MTHQELIQTTVDIARENVLGGGATIRRNSGKGRRNREPQPV